MHGIVASSHQIISSSLNLTGGELLGPTRRRGRGGHRRACASDGTVSYDLCDVPIHRLTVQYHRNGVALLNAAVDQRFGRLAITGMLSIEVSCR